MVYDTSRGIIYIANGNEVLRYGMDCGCMLNPIQISGAKLEGIDLSPDGKTLAVADNENDGSNTWVYLIDPDTLAVTKSSVAFSTIPELGSYAVSFLGDGTFDGFVHLCWLRVQSDSPPGSIHHDVVDD